MADTLRALKLTLDERVHIGVFGKEAGEKPHCKMGPKDADSSWTLQLRCARCERVFEATPGKRSRGMFGRCVPKVPRYSQDIAAAMLVAERVGGRLELDGYHGQGWTATLRGMRYFAPTPAEAICRAALLAVGAERQGGEGE